MLISIIEVVLKMYDRGFIEPSTLMKHGDQRIKTAFCQIYCQEPCFDVLS